MRASLALLLVASCGYPRLAAIGGDASSVDANTGGDSVHPDSAISPPDAPPCSDCQLVAIEPSVANTGDIVFLEGTFHDPVTVTFPGGATVAATVLGQHRATVTVPSSATAGTLTVTTAATTVGQVPFRRASFGLGLGQFHEGYVQAERAQQEFGLAAPRAAHASVLVGDRVYVLGGFHTTAIETVEMARVNADGTLGPFAPVTGVSLATARYYAAAIVIGSYLYVMGGWDSTGNATASVERAAINPDGTLSSFGEVAGIQLAVARSGLDACVIGNYLYVFGGGQNQDGTTNVVERAVINLDNSLGVFQTVDGVTLATSRWGEHCFVSGSYVYLVGGNSFGDIESAPINADGTIGTFSLVTGSTVPTQEAGFGVWGGRAWWMGGYDVHGTALGEVVNANIWDQGMMAPWSASSPMLKGVLDPSSTLVGTNLLVLGGSGNGTLGQTIADAQHAAINASGDVGAFATQTIALAAARGSPASAVIGNHIYVFGGTTQTGPLTVERAPISADGLVGAFATVPNVTLPRARIEQVSVVTAGHVYLIGGRGDASASAGIPNVDVATIDADGNVSSFADAGVSLVVARSGASAVVIGGWVYVLGGWNETGPQTSIERAAIGADGTLGAFQTVSGISLAKGREGQSVALFDSALYVIGGDATGSATSIERATVLGDGSLGAFSIVSGVTLVSARSGHASAVIGDYLYVFGGIGASSAINSVERAKYTGVLGTFSAVPTVTLRSARARATAVVLGNNVYLVGGSTDSGDTTYLSTIERATLQ